MSINLSKKIKYGTMKGSLRTKTAFKDISTRRCGSVNTCERERK